MSYLENSRAPEGDQKLETGWGLYNMAHAHDKRVGNRLIEVPISVSKYQENATITPKNRWKFLTHRLEIEPGDTEDRGISIQTLIST